MTDQSSRFRKYGIYTMDVRRRGMGTLPMPGAGGTAPSIQTGIKTPTATGAGWGVVPGTVPGPGTGVFPAQYRDRIANAALEGSGLARLKQPGISSALRALHDALLRIPVDGGRNVSAQSVKANMDFILGNQDIVQRLNDGLTTYWPGQTVQTIELMLVGTPASTPDTHAALTIDWRTGFNPGATSMTQGSGPTSAARTASRTVSSGGGGTAVQESALQPGVNAAMDARATEITPGPMSPYFGPTSVQQMVDQGAAALPPSSSMPSWLVPVLAALGGAALGAVTVRALVG